MRTLQSFIKDEIGMTNTIVQAKDWRELMKGGKSGRRSSHA